MNTKPTRFCGIDIAKVNHVACVITADEAVLVKKQSFSNTAQGFQQLLARLQQAGGPAEVLVGMEATGHYWYALHDFLVRQGYRVVVFNPLQTRQGRDDVRKSQTDRIDAYCIARVIKNGQGRSALVPGELGMTCRQLTRLRYALIRQSSQIKQLIWSRVQPVWPEYEGLFTDAFAPTSRAILQAAPTPADLLAMDPDRLTALVRRASRGRFTDAKADEILACAKDSAGMQRGLEGTRTSIRTLLAALDAMRPIRVQLESDIEKLAARLPQYILTLPGANPIRAVSLYGETDPIDHFATGSQLVAFAGLDMVVSQSGQWEASRKRISKRGSPVLRQTLWSMAHLAVLQEGPLRDFFLRKRKAGLHHLAAVTAAAVKLTRIAWRILTDQRDYIPDGCPVKS